MDHPYRTAIALPASRLVRAPRRARWVAVALGASFTAFGALAALSPWQQSVPGKGRVVAFAPTERQQRIEATIGGRVERWYVQEGSLVERNDPLVLLSDNAPEIIERLDEQVGAVEGQLTSYQAQVAQYEARLTALGEARASKIAAAQAYVRVAQQKRTAAEQKVEAAEAALATAQLNVARIRSLAADGLSSSRERELAELEIARTETSLASERAGLRSAEADVLAAQASLDATRAEQDAKLQEAQVSLESARTRVASAESSRAGLAVSRARQESQLIRSPRDGMVLRVTAGEGGEQVKQGDVLMILVPDTDEEAVELIVDGNDAALISPGRKVRLQFEGWPAVQFTGWPSVAVGTFGGVVAFVDATDNGRGDFRVFVVQDPDEPLWPSPRFLRQGVRANGWVLLETVPLGYELWRQFNGFPPALEHTERYQAGGSY